MKSHRRKLGRQHNFFFFQLGYLKTVSPSDPFVRIIKIFLCTYEFCSNLDQCSLTCTWRFLRLSRPAFIVSFLWRPFKEHSNVLCSRCLPVPPKNRGCGREERKQKLIQDWETEESETQSPQDFPHVSLVLFFFYFFKCLFFRQREKQSASRGGAEREGGRHRIQSRLQALSRQHRARRGPRIHKPWDHDPSQSRTLNRLSHPGAPEWSSFKM